jgi:thioredoxin reductase (NADPH)
LQGETAAPETTPTSDTSPPRGLPLTSSRVEQIFPKLTPAQIRRIAAHGHMRAIQRGEVLYDQGDSAVPFFVVVSGELEVVRPSGAVETLVTVHGPGQLTGEVGTLSGRRTRQKNLQNQDSK